MWWWVSSVLLVMVSLLYACSDRTPFNLDEMAPMGFDLSLHLPSITQTKREP